MAMKIKVIERRKNKKIEKCWLVVTYALVCKIQSIRSKRHVGYVPSNTSFCLFFFRQTYTKKWDFVFCVGRWLAAWRAGH